MKRYVLLSLFFLLLIAIFTFPAILHLSGNLLIGDGGDNYENFIFQFLAGEKIKALSWPFSHTDLMRYPVGFNFATGFESAITVLTGAILSLFLNNVLAYNLTILGFYFVNLASSFLLFRYITKNDAISIIGSIIFGASFFVIARSAGHINLFFLGGFMLFLYSILRLKDIVNTKNILLFHTSWMLIVLGSFLYTIMFGISALLMLPVAAYLFRSEVKHLTHHLFKVRYKFLLLAIPFLLITLVISFPHAHALITGDYYKPDRSDYDSRFYASPSIKDFVLPNVYLPLVVTQMTNGLNDSVKTIDKSVFIGWVEIVLFIAFLIYYKNKKVKYFVVAGASIFFVLTLGYIIPELNIPLPYTLLHHIFPFSFVDEPSRFFPIMYLFITIGIVMLLKQTYKKNPWVYILLFEIAGLLILERLPFNYWLTPTFKNDAFAKVVQKEDTTAVFDIAVSYTNSPYHLLPYIYDKKVVDGTFQWFADTDSAKAFIKDEGLTRFLCGDAPAIDQQTYFDNQKLIQTLRENDIKTIVVHKNGLAGSGKFYFPECANMRMQTTLLLPQLLMPNPTSTPQILSLFFPATPSIGDTITFPQDGTFTIQGFEAYPNDWLPIHMYLDGTEISINQEWSDKGNKISSLAPFTTIDVRKGSRLTLQFDRNQNTDYSFIKLWYVYKTTTTDPQFDSTNQIQKIYEDDNEAVFEIN